MLLLASIPYYITLYMGIPIYIFGFIGGLLNICLLFSNRHNPCTFLLMYSSIIDLLVINVGLLPRILSVGFSIDPTLQNLMWCKIRTYGLRITTLISLYTVCLMSVERLLVSCRTVRWRQLSNISFIRWTAIVVSLLIALEGLPFFILTDILRTGTSAVCTPMYNPIFAKYASFFCIPVLFGILPLGIIIAMSILISYTSRTRTQLRKAQRSLTLIILLRIVVVMLSCGPYTTYFIYSAIVSAITLTKSAERIAIENCILSVISIVLYITYSSSFFIYYCLSSAYRKQLIELFKYLQRKRRNVVHPEQVVRRKAGNIITDRDADATI